MKKMGVLVASLFSLTHTLYAQPQCHIPDTIKPFVTGVTLDSLKNISDVRRNYHVLSQLCVNQITFSEGKYQWKMLLVTHPKYSKGAFWFLPHDDENSAFDAALYATQKYGSGFLAVMANDSRYFAGQDPNRNFGTTPKIAKTCPQQQAAAPIYTQGVFRIIDTYRSSNYPYLALHNNKDGWSGNGGEGGVSILNNTPTARSYPANNKVTDKSRGLEDEDSMVYIAGMAPSPSTPKLKALQKYGMNTKYEIVTASHNDCSLSNYIVLSKRSSNYYNIETEHGDLATQKKMIDYLMHLIR
jgi:hypothetical protein